MPHAFDTGATVAQRTLIREGVAARLVDLRKQAATPRYLLGIKELPKKFDGGVEDVEMLMKFFNGSAPAIGIALGDLPFDPGGLESTDLTGELEVAVYAASQHQRDLVDGRLAADIVAATDLTADPGVETILEHALERLAGQTIGVAGVNKMVPKAEKIVATFGDITVGELTFTVQVERQINPARGEDQLVDSIEHRLASSDITPDELDEDGEIVVDEVHHPLVTTISALDTPED